MLQKNKIYSLFACTLPFIAVFLSLFIIKNITFIYILFYGVTCVLIPFIDLKFFNNLKYKELINYLGFINFKKTTLVSSGFGLVYLTSIYLFFYFLQGKLIDPKKIQNVLKQWDIYSKN